MSAFEKPDSVPDMESQDVKEEISGVSVEITPELTSQPPEDRTTDYTTIEPPTVKAKEAPKASTETVPTLEKSTLSPSPHVTSTAAATAPPVTTPPVTAPPATAPPLQSDSTELSKLGEMETLIEQLNFQNQEIQIQLQNYKENTENWTSTKENFQTGIFMLIMILFLCFLLSKVCKLPCLGRLKL